MKVEGLYQKLTEITCQTSEAFHFDDFELRGGELYYEGKSTSLMTGKGKLRSVTTIARILGKEGLRNFGFDLPRSSKVTAQQAIMHLTKLR